MSDPADDPPDEPELDEPRDEGTIEALRARTSVGRMSDEHWTRARADKNQEALEYLRERSHAPGVAEGGGDRNHYCMNCDGVIPLEYDSRKPSDKSVRHCPHCGVELEGNVRRMFNWVEIDQVHDSDLRAIWPVLAGGLLLIALLVYWIFV